MSRKLAVEAVFRTLARLQRGVDFFGAVLLEQHAEELVSRDRNDQKAAGHANHKPPGQEVSDNLDQEVKHFYRPRTRGHSTTNAQFPEYPGLASGSWLVVLFE